MLGFFKKKTKETVAAMDWSFLGTDMHSHFIPGIDDGPADMARSLELLTTMADAGFTKIITTPHISLDYYPNTEQQIREALATLQIAAGAAGLPLQLEAAAEYMIDEAFLQKIRRKEELLSINGKYVLIEMGFVQPSPLLQQVVFELQALGYQPLLAHPERYVYYQETYRDLQRLKDTGCMFQLNTIALGGYYGKQVKLFAEQLLKDALYEFAGTDIHHEKHVRALGGVLQSAISLKLLRYPFLNSKL